MKSILKKWLNKMQPSTQRKIIIQDTAKVAKERLQIIISHERTQRQNPHYLLAMKEEILEIVAKYIKIDKEAVTVQLEHSDGNAVLELNITVPERALNAEK